MALNLISAFTELPPPIDYVLPNMVAGTVGAIYRLEGPGQDHERFINKFRTL